MFFVVWTVADYMSGSHQTAQATALGYSDFTEKVTAGDVDKVVIVQNNIRGTLKDGTENNTANGTFQDSYKAAKIKNTHTRPKPRIMMV